MLPRGKENVHALGENRTCNLPSTRSDVLPLNHQGSSMNKVEILITYQQSVTHFYTERY